MTDLRKAAEMALEALMQKGEHHPKVYQAAEALRQALAQPKPEWVGLSDDEREHFRKLGFVGVLAVENKLKEKNS